MARGSRKSSTSGDDWLFPRLGTQAQSEDTSLLDVIDNVLNHGLVLHGELILGLANVDLIYAKLSVLLAALDKLPEEARLRTAATPPPIPKSRKRK